MKYYLIAGEASGDLHASRLMRALRTEDPEAQAKRELRENARPAIQGPLPNMEGVDAIVLGYPNWWGAMPMAVKTFLDGCDLTGVTIAPLCTNEGSGLGNSVSDLRRTYPAANVVEGLSVRGTDAARSTGRAISWAKKALA